MERLACGLRNLGIGHGDVVIVQLPNWAPFMILHMALTAIGAVTATIPIVYREHELTGVIRLTEAKALVVPREFHHFDYATMAEGLRQNVPTLEHVILVGGDPSDSNSGSVSYEKLMAEPWEARGGQDSLESLKPAADDIAALCFTSGTTGDLKGAVYDTRILHATNMGFIERYGFNEGDRIFGCSPIGHAVGFTHALRMTLTIGGSIVLQERWDPARALELLQAEKCTFLAAATPFLMDLVYHPDLEKRGEPLLGKTLSLRRRLDPRTTHARRSSRFARHIHVSAVGYERNAAVSPPVLTMRPTRSFSKPTECHARPWS